MKGTGMMKNTFFSALYIVVYILKIKWSIWKKAWCKKLKLYTALKKYCFKEKSIILKYFLNTECDLITLK